MEEILFFHISHKLFAFGASLTEHIFPENFSVMNHAFDIAK